MPASTSPAPAIAREPPAPVSAPGPASTATPPSGDGTAQPGPGARALGEEHVPKIMTQTGSVASSSPAVDAGSHCSPTVTGKL